MINRIALVEGRLVAIREKTTTPHVYKGVTFFGHDPVIFALEASRSEQFLLSPEECGMLYNLVPGPDTILTVSSPATAGAKVQEPGS